jgi:hypothetical protein
MPQGPIDDPMADLSISLMAILEFRAILETGALRRFSELWSAHPS